MKTDSINRITVRDGQRARTRLKVTEQGVDKELPRYLYFIKSVPVGLV